MTEHKIFEVSEKPRKCHVCGGEAYELLGNYAEWYKLTGQTYADFIKEYLRLTGKAIKHSYGCAKCVDLREIIGGGKK
jgi:hypothetical protein